MGLNWGTTLNPIIDVGGTPALPDALATVAPWAEAVDGTLFSLNVLIADVVFVRFHLNLNILYLRFLCRSGGVGQYGNADGR